MTNARLEKAMADIEAKKAEWYKAFEANDAAAMNNSEVAMRAAEKDYNEISMQQALDECKHEGADPVISAIYKFVYPVIRHKLVKEDGIVTGIELINGTKNFDLVKVLEHYRLPYHTATYTMERAGVLMVMRLAEKLEWTAKNVKAIEATHFQSSGARNLAEKMTSAPTSNTQAVKLLQACLDTFMFEDNGKGGNKHRCLNADVAYVEACIGKRSRDGKAIDIAKPRFFVTLMTDIAHRILTNGQWGLNFKKVDDKNTESKKDVAKKVDGKKTESKKDVAKKVDGKKTESKKDVAKKVDGKKTESKKDVAKKVDGKKTESKKDVAKKVDGKKTESKKDVVKKA